jgi:uncharacterized repeat protein (TIGR03803 family)
LANTQQEEFMKRNGSLWNAGTTLLLLVLVTLVFDASSWGASKTLFEFTVGKGDGLRPLAGLIFDQSGNLYGTTSRGGAHGGGTVFKLTPNGDGTWTESVLYSFKAGNDGASPHAGVIFDQAGNLYGTTAVGGPSNAGTVFKLTPNGGRWTESVLYGFSGGSDGSQPEAGLILDAGGNLYGTTVGGGAHAGGTVFKLTPNATESVLYSFCSVTKCRDGMGPAAGLIFDQAGNLYGTTRLTGPKGNGVVFKLAPNAQGGWTESVLHSFTGGNDGSQPVGGLIFDASGNLYGTTWLGGIHLAGIAFKLTPNANGTWKETVLRSFTRSTGGGNPAAGLIFDQPGNVYGTTMLGGPHGHGVAFKLTPTAQGAWHETVLVYFDGHLGVFPHGDLILDAAGNLYGTTFGLGSFFQGSVFEITP